VMRVIPETMRRVARATIIIMFYRIIHPVI